jgi:hypothetical protein
MISRLVAGFVAVAAIASSAWAGPYEDGIQAYGVR